jgi:hypothetical protein
MLDESSRDPALGTLSEAQRRCLAELERRLNSEEPVLAEAMRTAQSNARRTDLCRLAVAAGIGVPVAVLSAAVAGAAVATVTAVSLVSEVLDWTRPQI